uniref:SET domain-containing protein n=1 Tax=Kalanchoe fedtschenkoi TaxID=63787 RepID=A0A7N0TFA5_KALFE
MVDGIDERFAEQVRALLQPPTPLQVQEYYHNLLTERQIRGLKVKQNVETGKGVYADLDFAEEDVVLKDQMLFGIQHSYNKMDCFVCSFCFRFIGSIEIQIGKQLYFQSLGISMDIEDHNGTCSHASKASCWSNSSDDEGTVGAGDSDSSEGCAPSILGEINPLPIEVVESLMNGELRLPLSGKFALPSVVPCPGDCGEAYYCSESCAKADWESFHSLLCIGINSKSLCRQALKQFVEHANETNDIFLLAAKAIAFTILRYKKFKPAHCEEIKDSAVSTSTNLSVLLEAWKPISMGHKKGWWNCIGEPDDISKLERKELALTSLQFLREAMFDEEFGALFTLEIYGHIIGMFELNNLDLIVESPVEDYIQFITDLPDQKKKEVEKDIRPVLNALGEDYTNLCRGTAFYPLQSCMNHSCCPNTKAFKREEDRDGLATVIASRLIHKGEEITISYINEDLPYEERQELLADYNFTCKCSKCVRDQSHTDV